MFLPRFPEGSTVLIALLRFPAGGAGKQRFPFVFDRPRRRQAKQTGKDLEVKKEDFGEDGDKYFDAISKVPVWPVLNIRFTYRIF